MEPPPALPLARPKSLMVFGVMNLLFGAYSLVAAIPGAFMMLNPERFASNPVIQVMKEDAVYAAFQKALIVPGMLSMVALVAGGIGLVKAREWGRKASIWWALYFIVATPLTTWMTAVHVHPAMMKQIAEQMAKQGTATSESVIAGMKVGMTVVTIGSTVLFVAYGILLVAMLSRAKVKAYCLSRR